MTNKEAIENLERDCYQLNIECECEGVCCDDCHIKTAIEALEYIEMRNTRRKNHEYIRQLKVKELAEFLIRSEEVNEGDEGIDGEWQDYYVTHYCMPNGDWSYSYEDAVLYTIDWLNADWSEEE